MLQNGIYVARGISFINSKYCLSLKRNEEENFKSKIIEYGIQIFFRYLLRQNNDYP